MGKIMKPIEEAAETLRKTGKQFVIIVDNGKTTDMRIKYTYKSGLVMIYDIAKCMMEDYVPSVGYLVHEDIRGSVEKAIQDSDARPDEEVIQKTEEALRNLFSKLSVEGKSPEQYFHDLRYGEEDG